MLRVLVIIFYKTKKIHKVFSYIIPYNNKKHTHTHIHTHTHTHTHTRHFFVPVIMSSMQRCDDVRRKRRRRSRSSSERLPCTAAKVTFLRAWLLISGTSRSHMEARGKADRQRSKDTLKIVRNS